MGATSFQSQVDKAEFGGHGAPLQLQIVNRKPFSCLILLSPTLRDFPAENDITKEPIDPIKVYSKKELVREIVKIMPTLIPKKIDPSTLLLSRELKALFLETIAFCLVDVYVLLGKAFWPYLEGLNSTQLRLVTIYGKQISQARTGATIDANVDQQERFL